MIPIIKTFNSWRSGVLKSCGHCKESSLGKVRTKLGRTLLYHLGSWHQSILFGRFGRACSTTSLECKQFKEVLLLINIFMINIFVRYIRSLYFLLFNSYKCLNLNSIMPEVLGPNGLGQLTLIRSLHKCLNLNSIMPEILGPDDLGQLTLIRNLHKCLNLNSIMPEVLGPDDLGQLTLICSSYVFILKFNHA